MFIVHLTPEISMSWLAFDKILLINLHTRLINGVRKNIQNFILPIYLQFTCITSMDIHFGSFSLTSIKDLYKSLLVGVSYTTSEIFSHGTSLSKNSNELIDFVNRVGLG